MRRRNPPRQAALRKIHHTYCIKSMFSSRSSPMDNERTNSPNTNRKRATDDSSTQPPARRQRNATTSIGSRTAPTVGSDVAQSVSGLEINQATVQPKGPHHSAEHITCRIARYKSALQALEADHKTLSQSRDPEAVSRVKRLLGAIAISRRQTATKLNKIKEAINQMTKTISDCRDVVPTQLHQALKAIKTDRKTSKSKLYKIKELEAKKKQQLKDAERNHREVGAKLGELRKQMNKCKLNLRSAEQDLNNVLLQQRLDSLSRFNVSTLPYDQRLCLSKLIGQATTILDGGSGTSVA
ncbi:hypothetical protein FSPOR_7393 [Fusarium sporotrichioides]|uniref:Uncharacterized protein n=1 Tax=Fusarium sporotrichioides TaxID=5514 RepID=A0A395RZN0_FUSSP|nr:hypothetical protein FSPOR_7393 [Fusarium sporotrichioides]